MRDKGRVKHFNEKKGFGFIINERIKEDVFFHIANVNAEEIKKGDVLEYEVGSTSKGPFAFNIEIISE